MKELEEMVAAFEMIDEHTMVDGACCCCRTSERELGFCFGINGFIYLDFFAPFRTRVILDRIHDPFCVL
jgi:hypothetical protein